MISQDGTVLTWDGIEASSFFKKFVSSFSIFSGLVARQPCSVDEALQGMSNSTCAGLVCSIEQLEEVCSLAGEAARGKELHVRHDVVDTDGIADAVADICHFSSPSQFSRRILRLYVEDPSQVESVEACAQEELARQGDRKVEISVGFPLHRHVSKTMGKLRSDLCFLRLEPIEQGEIRNLARFIKNIGPRGKRAVIEYGERPALTRQLPDGRLEIGWINIEICGNLHYARDGSVLAETDPNAISFWVSRLDYGVNWNDHFGWVGLSEAYEHVCRYDTDQVMDLRSGLEQFSWTLVI